MTNLVDKSINQFNLNSVKVGQDTEALEFCLIPWQFLRLNEKGFLDSIDTYPLKSNQT